MGKYIHQTTSPNFQCFLFSLTVDLTVDWINDKLYWVDGALCNVHEFNIMTNATRFVLSTGTSETSFPRGIVIYPYKDNGLGYSTFLHKPHFTNCLKISVDNVRVIPFDSLL